MAVLDPRDFREPKELRELEAPKVLKEHKV
jgi:hypothetical protein